MQTITTKYHGPTSKGSRVSATASFNTGKLFLSWDNALNSDQNHLLAARALRDKLGWNDKHYGVMHGGYLAERTNSMVWVFSNDRLKIGN